jgi:hypothetical protein
MFQPQQITGPVPSGVAPQQVSGPSAYYPLQTTTDPTSGMFSSMMPMIMMVLMFALIGPMLKVFTGNKE